MFSSASSFPMGESGAPALDGAESGHKNYAGPEAGPMTCDIILASPFPCRRRRQGNGKHVTDERNCKLHQILSDPPVFLLGNIKRGGRSRCPVVEESKRPLMKEREPVGH